MNLKIFDHLNSVQLSSLILREFHLWSVGTSSNWPLSSYDMILVVSDSFFLNPSSLCTLLLQICNQSFFQKVFVVGWTVALKKIGSSPNSWYFSMWLYLERGFLHMQLSLRVPDCPGFRMGSKLMTGGVLIKKRRRRFEICRHRQRPCEYRQRLDLCYH